MAACASLVRTWLADRGHQLDAQLALVGKLIAALAACLRLVPRGSRLVKVCLLSAATQPCWCLLEGG